MQVKGWADSGWDPTPAQCWCGDVMMVLDERLCVPSFISARKKKSCSVSASNDPQTNNELQFVEKQRAEEISSQQNSKRFVFPAPPQQPVCFSSSGHLAALIKHLFIYDAGNIHDLKSRNPLETGPDASTTNSDMKRPHVNTTLKPASCGRGHRLTCRKLIHQRFDFLSILQGTDCFSCTISLQTSASLSSGVVVPQKHPPGGSGNPAGSCSVSLSLGSIIITNDHFHLLTPLSPHISDICAWMMKTIYSLQHGSVLNRQNFNMGFWKSVSTKSAGVW